MNTRLHAACLLLQNHMQNREYARKLPNYDDAKDAAYAAEDARRETAVVVAMDADDAEMQKALVAEEYATQLCAEIVEHQRVIHNLQEEVTKLNLDIQNLHSNRDRDLRVMHEQAEVLNARLKTINDCRNDNARLRAEITRLKQKD